MYIDIRLNQIILIIFVRSFIDIFFRSDIYMYILTRLHTNDVNETSTFRPCPQRSFYFFSYSLSYLQNRIINNNLIFSPVRHLCPCNSFYALPLFSFVHICSNQLSFLTRGIEARLLFWSYIIMPPIANDHDGHARLSRHCHMYFQ